MDAAPQYGKFITWCCTLQTTSHFVLVLALSHTISGCKLARATELLLKQPSLVVQAKVLPVLVSIIRHANSNSPVLVEGALDLVGSLMRPAAAEQAQQMHALLAQPVQALLLQHDDPGVLQSCSQYLK